MSGNTIFNSEDLHSVSLEAPSQIQGNELSQHDFPESDENLPLRTSNDMADAFEMSLTDSENSHEPLPLLECTPAITNDITPNVSLTDDCEESENSTFDFQKVLLSVGYDQPAIKNAFKNLKSSYEWQSDYGRSRPPTHVFTKGKVFSYPKLEIPTQNESKRARTGSDKRISLVDRSCPGLNLSPHTGVSNIKNDLGNDAITILKNIRIENLKNVIVGQLNINSLRNKFHDLVELIDGNIDIMVLTETKLDNTFPEKQFLIPGYKKPYRSDRN